MTNRLKLILLIALITLSIESCVGTDKNEVVKVYPDGTIVNKKYYTANDTNNYVKTVYRQDGVILDSCGIKNNKIHGVRMMFDEIDNLTYYVNYENGITNGSEKAYYLNGAPYMEGQSKYGTKIGAFYFYTEDGKLMTYTHYIDLGPIYRIHFDKNGKIIKRSGTGLLYYRTPSDTVKISEIVDLEIDLVNPKFDITSDIYKVESSSNSSLSRTNSTRDNDIKTIKYNYISNKLGVDSLFFYWKVYNAKNSFIDTGRTVVLLNVASKANR